MSVTVKYTGTRDAVAIHREAFCEVSTENGNEIMQGGEGVCSLLPFLSCSCMTESLRLRKGFMETCPQYLCRKDGRTYLTLPPKVLTTEDRGSDLSSFQKAKIWQAIPKG